MRLPVDTSRLKFSVVAGVESFRRYKERKPRDSVSLSSDKAGGSAVGQVTWGEGRRQIGEAA